MIKYIRTSPDKRHRNILLQQESGTINIYGGISNNKEAKER
jgi:hypothetical protein